MDGGEKHRPQGHLLSPPSLGPQEDVPGTQISGRTRTGRQRLCAGQGVQGSRLVPRLCTPAHLSGLPSLALTAGRPRLGEARLPGAFQPRQLRGAPRGLGQLPQRYDLAAGPPPARSTRRSPERDRPPSSGSSYLRRGAQSPEGPPEGGRGSAGVAPAPGCPHPAARSSLQRSLRGGPASGSLVRARSAPSGAGRRSRRYGLAEGRARAAL